MKIRIFGNSRAYIFDTNIELLLNANNQYILPIDTRYVDIDTITTNENYPLQKVDYAIVMKDDITYTGILIKYNDYVVTISNNDTNIVIKDYDTIQIDSQIVVLSETNTLKSLSYITTGINTSIQHIIHIDEKEYELKCIIYNTTTTTFLNANLELMTIEDKQKEHIMYSMMEDRSSNSHQLDNSNGTIFIIDESHDILAGYEVAIPIINSAINISKYYTLEANNSYSKGVYTLAFLSPADIPAGIVYIYQNSILEATNTINGYAKDQIMYIPLNKIQSIYSKGHISKNSKMKNNIMFTTVTLTGDIVNKLSEPATIYLEYPIGTYNIDIDVPIFDGNIYFTYKLGPNGTSKYNHTFTLNS